MSQNAVVTGAGSGVGRAVAIKLAAAGWNAALLGRREAAVRETAGVDSARMFSFACDVGAADQVRKVFAAIHDRFESIDLLVNAAGTNIPRRSFEELSIEDYQLLINTNLNGAFYCAQAVLPAMRARGRGTIVNIVSDAGKVGSTGETVYSAAKGGVIAFTRSLARELARRKVRVNCVCPGPTATPFLDVFQGEGGQKVIEAMTRMVPFRRLAQPEEIAAAVAFLASEDAGYITGQALSVSGGLTMQ